MGKQFNYYISPEEDIAFTQELIELGYCIMKFVVVDKKDDAYMVKWEEVDLSEEKEDITDMTYIYKEEWGSLRGDIFIKSDINKEPVIELSHCKVWETTKKLGRGRIYLNTVYKDEIATFDAVEKDFRKIVRLVNGNYDEIWKINKMFIDKQIAANKTIFLTNSPFELYLFESGELRFYQRELNYLTELGYRFEKVGTNLWIAIKN